jgi:ATP-dependent DNA helicase RecQ
LAGRRAAAGEPTAGKAEPTGYDAQLFSRLRILRRALADDLHIPAYIIFGDRTLIEMATRLPQSLEEMRLVYGVGEHKLKHFGEQFVACVRTFCAEEGIDPAPRAPETLLVASKRRFEEMGELFEDGRSVAELQTMFDVKRATVIQHLERYQQAGHLLDHRRVLTESELAPELQRGVLRRLTAFDTTLLGPIMEEFGGLVSYDELRLLRLYLACRGAQDDRAFFELRGHYAATEITTG